MELFERKTAYFFLETGFCEAEKLKKSINKKRVSN